MTLTYLSKIKIPFPKQNMLAEFDKVNKWFSDNKLIQNTDKTQFNIFCRKNKAVPNQLDQMNLSNTIVKRSHHVQYLGMILNVIFY